MFPVSTLSAVVTDELVACEDVDASDDRLVVADTDPGAAVAVVVTGATVLLLLARLVLLSLLRILPS